MKNLHYPAVFHPEDTGYSVSVPDIEGCFTQGDTLDEALEMVQDAIGLMLDGCTECPAASSPADVRPQAGDFVRMVPFDRLAYKRRTDTRAVKKTLTIPCKHHQSKDPICTVKKAK